MWFSDVMLVYYRPNGRYFSGEMSHSESWFRLVHYFCQFLRCNRASSTTEYVLRKQNHNQQCFVSKLAIARPQAVPVALGA